MKKGLFKRGISALLILCILVGMVPTVAQQAQAATTLVSTSAAPSTTATEVDALFAARSEGQHPRILADADKFAEIRQKIQTDDYSRVLYARLYDYCLEQVDEPVCTYQIPDGVRLLSVSRKASARIIWMAMLYQLSGERRFAERAVAEMLQVCDPTAFKDWNPSHYLDVGQMAYGVGIGYDWLYHYMTEDQRVTIRTALYNYALMTAYNPTKDTYKGVFTSTSNWNPWCMAGIAIAASAIYEYYPEHSSTIMAKTVESIQGSLALLTPLGAYPEGSSYYRLGMEFSAIYFETMLSVLGTDFGLSDLPGVRESGRYLLATTGYVSTFNFGDCSEQLLDGAMLHWYASRYNMPELSIHQRKHQSRNSELMDEPLALIWYDPELVADYNAEDSQRDYLMLSDHYQSVASFRSFEADPAMVYAAIKSGYNSTSHADMDVGSFVMEAMGERWFLDLGKDNYNLSGYGTFSNGYKETIGRWTYYRKRTEGHNTLVINPGTRGGQDSDAACQIVDYKSSYDGGYATVDMLDAYNDDGDGYGEVVTSAKRGLMLFDNRSRVLLRDELTCASPSEVYWFAHTEAEITIAADGKSAELVQNGKKLLAQIIAPANAVFTKMNAEPLATSPNPDGQADNAGISKLAIHLTNVQSTEITVVFTPILQESDRNKPLPDVTLATMGTQLNDFDSSTKLQKNAEGIYEIYTLEQLCLLSHNVRVNGVRYAGDTFKLMNDIDMQGRTFLPIGGCTPYTPRVNGVKPEEDTTVRNIPFHGTFDGNGHVIKNLLIYEPDSKNVGFFGALHGATIRNLGIESGVVFGAERTGGLAGQGVNTTVENCYNKADVIAVDMHAGGLFGQFGGGTEDAPATMQNCYNNADVKSGYSSVGGLVGYISSKSNVAISNCYHVGTLKDSANQTGLIGYYVTEKDAEYEVGTVTVDNCYATTVIKPAVIPDENENSDPRHEYYTNCAQISETELIGKALTLGSGFIYDCEWENDGYPVLSWQCDTQLPDNLALSTEAELRLLAYSFNSGTSYSGKTVTLLNDIDLGSREWIPIGRRKTGSSNFNGTFDGRGYAVKNLRVSTAAQNGGFFSGISGTVKNFGIKSGYVKGTDRVGGISGYLEKNSKMDNCYNRAMVQGSSFVGGLVGQAKKATFTNCYNAGSVTSGNQAGGLVGYFDSGAGGATITNCYNAGSLSGSKKGGLVCSVSASVTSNIVISNSFALSGVALFYAAEKCTNNNDSCASLDEAALKGKAENLGSAYATDTSIPQNDGYPVLNSSLYGSTAIELASTLQPVSNVYSISTADELRAFAYMFNVLKTSFTDKTIKLCADIDLENHEWIPIGGNMLPGAGYGSAFKGTFDGDGHRIYNMAITRGNSFVGLFGYVQDSTVKNVGIESGCVFGSTGAAGISGATSKSTIDSCFNKANVSGFESAGGIAGVIGTNNTISNCYNTASVDARDNPAGGIVGFLNSNAKVANIVNCYNLGTQGAGIIGYFHANASSATLTNCYTIDSVELVGAGTLSLSTCGKKTAAELRDNAALLGSAYAKDYLAQNNIYPVLAWENRDAVTSLTQDAQDVYLINNVSELRLLSYLTRVQYLDGFKNKKILLTADIDLERKQWLPIGGSGAIFRGFFNGGGHTVSNVLAFYTDSKYVGLFGAASTGRIENVGVESGCMTGTEHVGGIVGNLTGGAEIRNCYNKATVFAPFHVGGLVGMINTNNVWVTDCYNTGAVYAEKTTSQAGGLVGYLASGTKNVTIENCYDVGSYISVLCSISTGANSSAEYASGNIIKNVYSIGGVKTIYSGTTNAGGPALASAEVTLVTSANMQSYYTKLSSSFVYDKHNFNHGYPVLAWERSDEITDRSYLFYDFNDEETDRLRYADYTYGFVQGDDPNATNWVKASAEAAAVSLDTEKGVLIIDATSPLGETLFPGVYTDPYDAKISSSSPLHYNPAQAEVVQIRFKMDNFRNGEQIKNGKEEEKTPYFKVQYLADSSTSLINGNKDYTDHAAYIDSEQWVIATVDLNSGFKSAKEIKKLHIFFGGMEGISAEQPGKITIDYIYVGPREKVPGQENLYFTFNNTEEDRTRYNTKTYGYTQFDDAEEVHWKYNSNLLTNASIANGALNWDVAGTYPASDYPAVYADTYTTGNAEPLHYDPANAEVYQIRFKMEGIAGANSPYVDMHLWGLDDDGNAIGNAKDDKNPDKPYLDQPNKAIPKNVLTSGEYFIITVDLNKDRLANCAEITKFRPYFGQVKSADANKPGKISIDYIYMGTEEDLPIKRYKVTFVDGDGKVLQSDYVHEGEAAVAPTKTPTKQYTAGKHYIFKGWDKDLSNITANTTITAVFTAIDHSYTYSRVDGNVHTAACSCGYSKSEGHGWNGGSVSTAPSCTAGGVKTYTCTLCGQTKTEALSPTGHTVAVDRAVAPTCTETGLTEGSHCSACNVVLVAQIVIPANGHSYRSAVTPPTCTDPGYTTYTCSDCGDGYTELIPATGHTEVELPAVAPTCTETGLTAGKKCSVCGAVTVEQTAIDALGHAFNDGVITTPPTCTDPGYTTYTCDNDASHTYTESIEKLLHTDRNSDGLCDECHCNTNAETQDIILDFAQNAERNVVQKAVFEDISPELLSHAVLVEVISDTTLGTATILDNTTLHFTPGDMISEIICLNCKVEITKDGSRYYRLIPVNIVPATAVYYETDFAEGVFDLTATSEAQIADESANLYFDFKNSVLDRERYKNPVYGGHNYDTEWWCGRHTLEAKSYNNAEGTISFKTKVGYDGADGYDSYIQPSGSVPNRFSLQYNPANADVIYIRMKLENFIANGTPGISVGYYLGDDCDVVEGDGDTDELYNLEYRFKVEPCHLELEDYFLVEIPATALQKHERISTFRFQIQSMKSNGSEQGIITVDYVYVGRKADFEAVRAKYNRTWQAVADGTDAAEDAVKAEQDEIIYGYDRGYENDPELSNGSSLYVEGVGTPLITYKTDENGKYILDEEGKKISIIDYTSATEYTEASFTFTGTGFDIISRTGMNQGMIRAVVLDSTEAVVKNVSIISRGVLELHQIPVISIHDLAYGTYTVKIFVNQALDYGNDGDADVFGGALDRGGEFYFDALRIYNPINTNSTDVNSVYAYEVYQKHGEADPTLTELRDILIDANSFTAGSTMNGVVYLDATALPGTNFDNENGKLTAAIAKYKAIGPKNEVYLRPGNAIAFKLEVDGPIPASIDIGAKSANGEEVSMVVSVTTTVPTTLPTAPVRELHTSTALFYPMDILASQWETVKVNNKDIHYVYVTVYNSGAQGILSITDIKYAYDFPNPDEPVSRKAVRFVVDTPMLEMYSATCAHTWDQGEITTAPTCTTTGVKTFTCTACGSYYTETLVALGHSYTDGVCICGQTEVKEPVQQTSWKLSHSLNLASDISVNLVIPKSLLAGFDMATVYVESELDIYEGNEKTGTETLRISPVENGNYYYFTLDGLTAVQMNDQISSVLYGSKDGQPYYSPVDEYSIATYAYAQLNKAEATLKLKTLCADLLRYGAKAQIFKGYRSDSLADRDMTEEHRAYLSDIEAVSFGNTNEILEDLPSASLTWVGKSLNLESKVSLKFVFALGEYHGNLDELHLRVTYRDLYGETVSTTVWELEEYNAARRQYAFSFDSLLAAELRNVVSVQIYAGDTPVSATLQYSPDAYGNNKTGTLLDLCKALFAYSDSAKAYFAN